MSPLEEDFLAPLDRAIEKQSRIGDVPLKSFAVTAVGVVNFFEAQGLLFEDRLEINVFLFDIVAELLAEGSYLQ